MEDDTDDYPVPPMVLIYQQALNTFDDQNQEDFSSDFNQLKSLLDTLKAEDLKFDKGRFMNPELWKKPGKAPCSHIEVFLNGIIGMSIIMLKPGFKIPLHDHPRMHGLLKVISGKVRIKRFNKFPLGEGPSFEDHAAHEGASATERIYAQITEDSICTENSETCMLTPTISNYHEIEAINEPAAFFNLLSQPYANPPPITMHQGICVRRCNYYVVARQMNSTVVELKAIMKPDWFHFDSADYKGNILFSFGPY